MRIFYVIPFLVHDDVVTSVDLNGKCSSLGIQIGVEKWEERRKREQDNNDIKIINKNK